jgi:hypothetical protein
MKKKADKEQIDTLKSSLYYKIFDILNIDDKIYYLDREFNLIWDELQDVIGIINKTEYIFFSYYDEIINSIEKESPLLNSYTSL